MHACDGSLSMIVYRSICRITITNSLPSTT